MKKEKHKHIWHLSKIYYKAILSYPLVEKRVSSWICPCGAMKEVEVKPIEEIK